jgi:hypothetical protein
MKHFKVYLLILSHHCRHPASRPGGPRRTRMIHRHLRSQPPRAPAHASAQLPICPACDVMEQSAPIPDGSSPSHITLHRQFDCAFLSGIFCICLGLINGDDATGYPMCNENWQIIKRHFAVVNNFFSLWSIFWLQILA